MTLKYQFLQANTIQHQSVMKIGPLIELFGSRTTSSQSKFHIYEKFKKWLFYELEQLFY